jgi:RsiW-degrading membrane proteinase PrsW (M82 family)
MRGIALIVVALVIVYAGAWAHGQDPVFQYVIGFLWGFVLCGLIVWVNRRELSASFRPATEDRPADKDPWSVAQQVRRAQQGSLAPPAH